MFLDNACAVSGSAFDNNVFRNKIDNCVIVPDNERRSSIAIKNLEKLIEVGYNVCLWPDHILEKDVNAMVKDGNKTPQWIQNIIDDNTFSGIRAKLELAKWKII
jgi:hypothetical protein